MPDISLSSELLAGIALLAVLPFILITTTSFVKLAVVFALLRNALGIQQIPPNMVIYGLALILTAYIMFPIGHEIAEIVLQAEQTGASPIDYAQEAIAPLNAFMQKHTDPNQFRFFEENVAAFWEGRVSVSEPVQHFFALMPSFAVSELSDAFKIGFLIYLPFIAIDIVVSNILLAMGMMMVSPVTISLPFKLFLFVTIDGWTRLINGLVSTYM